MTKTRPPPQGWKEWYLDKGRPVNRGQDRVEIQKRFSSSNTAVLCVMLHCTDKT